MCDDAKAECMRVMAGVPSATHEYKDEVNPLELRLTSHAVGWNKGCYIGQEVISRLDSYDKVARLLIGFECDATGFTPAEGLKLTAQGKPLGRVTSIVPGGPGMVGLAVVKREAAQPGQAELQLNETTSLPVRLVDRAFFRTEAFGAHS